MRWLSILISVVLIGLAGLWFFTPVLDATYARIAPTITHSRTASVATSGQIQQRQSAPRTTTAPAASAKTNTQARAIASKSVFDNVMSMINVVTGLLGLWFGWLSYRMQRRLVEQDKR